MATFNYARKDGSMGSIEAADQAAALSMLPADANPRSGVQAMLSGTGTPAPSAAAEAPAGDESPLLSFASSLDAAVNLARQKRNESSLDMMKPFRGTVAASDFNSILGNLNQASDSTSADLIKRATETASPDASDVLTVTNDRGAVSGISKATGEVLWTTEAGVGNQQDTSGDTVGVSSKNITALKNALNASKFEGGEADGQYADPNLYLANYHAWLAAGHPAEEFFRNFPPSTYVNPDNTFLPEEIMQFVEEERSL